MWLSLAQPLQGTWPVTQAWALTGNQTGDPVVHRLALNPLSHTSQEAGVGYIFRNSFVLCYEVEAACLVVWPRPVGTAGAFVRSEEADRRIRTMF